MTLDPRDVGQGLCCSSCKIRGAHLPYINRVPKIIGSSLAEHRERTRLQVFEALTELLEHRDYGSISMVDLATVSGIGRTALYNHFRDKDDVVVAYATAETERYLERLGAQLETAGDDVLESLRVYVRTHRELANELHLGFGPELYAMLSRESLVRIREHVQDVEAVLRDLLVRGRDEGVLVVDDLDATVSLVHACLQRREVDTMVVEAFVVRALRPSPVVE